jgi:hypothetical protein
MNRFLLAVLICMTMRATHLDAANLIWMSDITDANGADKGFVDLLVSASHNVERVDSPAMLSAADIAKLNAADAVIVGRANGSGQFQAAAGELWNSQVTSPVIVMSAYLARDNRMRWVAGNDLPDSGPTPLQAAIPEHPVFSGVSLNPDGTTMGDYNVMIDRGTSTNTNLPVGGTVIAWNPSVQTNATQGVAIAEWQPGAVIGGGMALAGYRMLFNAGSREPDGGAVTDAGKLDLTPLGQQIFLNAVGHAVSVPEPSSAVIGYWIGLTFLGLLRRRPRR